MFSFATELSLPEYLCARATGMTGRAHSRVHGTMCRTCKNKNHRKCCTSCHGLCCAHGSVVLISVPGPRSTNTPQKQKCIGTTYPPGSCPRGSGIVGSRPSLRIPVTGIVSIPAVKRKVAGSACPGKKSCKRGQD